MLLPYAGQDAVPRNKWFTLKKDNNTGSKGKLGYQFMNKSPMPKNNTIINQELDHDDEILALSSPLGKAAHKQITGGRGGSKLPHIKVPAR